MIKNLVFDFGGVIADLNRQGAVDAFIAIGLKDADTRLDKYHQTGIFQELEEGRISDSEFIRIMEELCQRSLTWPEVQQAWLGFLSGVDIKKLHLLEELRQEGYPPLSIKQHKSIRNGMGMQQRLHYRRQVLSRIFRPLVSFL